MNSNIKLPGFEEVVVLSMEEVEEKLRIHVEMPVKAHVCPVCGKSMVKIHDYRIQKIKHLKLFERQTLFFYKKRRYACQCGKKFAESNPFVDRYQRISVELNEAIKIRSIKGKTFKETAEIYRTFSSTVVRRFFLLAEATVNEEAKELPFDEYKGDTREGKYQLIIADGFTRELIDILENVIREQSSNT